MLIFVKSMFHVRVCIKLLKTAYAPYLSGCEGYRFPSHDFDVAAVASKRCSLLGSVWGNVAQTTRLESAMRSIPKVAQTGAAGLQFHSTDVPARVAPVHLVLGERSRLG